MKAKLVLALLLSVLAQASAYTQSDNTYNTDGSLNDVQAALNAAPDGALINLPSGTFTWSNYLTGKKGVTLQGAGVGKTTVETRTPQQYHFVLSLKCTSVPTVVRNISWTNQFNIDIGGDKTSASWRIYNCTFDAGTTASVIFINAGGNTPGLIDHCTFSAGSGEFIHNFGGGSGNTAGWQDDVNPGTKEAVYVENCTFTKNPLQDAYFWGTSALQSYYGARTVVRYNIINAGQVDQHGTAGSVGARWFEIYKNTFYVPGPSGSFAGMNQATYVVLRGGSGVVWGNQNTGQNVYESGGIELYDENDQSKPPLYLARGINQNYSPVYIWDNTAPNQPDGKMKVWSSSSNVKADRDYFVSNAEPTSMKKWQKAGDNANTTYRYSPYQYPHELDDLPSDKFEPVSGGGPNPTPTPTPTPTPNPTPSPTPQPTPTPSPGLKSYSNWLNQLSDWINQHPATPDK